MIPNFSGPGRARFLGIVLLAATFLAGGLSGAALERRASAEPPRIKRQQEKTESDQSNDDRQHGRRRSILDQVDLSAEQRAAIDSILQAGREKVDAYWKETEPGYRALVDSTRAQVRAVLTPEQQAEYDRLRAEHRARSRANDGNGGGKDNGSGGKGISHGNSPRKVGGVGWGKVSSLDRHAESKETMTE